MRTEKIIHRDEQYTLHIAYQADDSLRAAFNRMTHDFWSFDFEDFYQSGYWIDDCIIYSLFHNDTIVSHITLSLFSCRVGQQQLILGQPGTVMTAKAYQHRGLSRYLMERIQADYSKRIDGMFLFANDTVLDFYQRFGFTQVSEFQAGKKITHKPNGLQVQRLDLDQLPARAFFQDFIERSPVVSSFDTTNAGLIFFYCYAYPRFGFKDTVYHIPDLETIVVAKTKDKVLTIVQVFSLKEVAIDDIIGAIAPPETSEVVFGYNAAYPGLTYSPHKQEDLTLFVTPELEAIFKTNKVMVPLLSHA